MARNLSPWRTKELDLQVIWHDLWLWKIGDMYRIDSNWQTQVGNGSETPSRPNSCTIHELWMMQTKWKSSQACLCLPISLSSQVALVLNGRTPVDWSPIGLPDASTRTHRLRTSKSFLSILSTCFSSFSFLSQSMVLWHWYRMTVYMYYKVSLQPSPTVFFPFLIVETMPPIRSHRISSRSSPRNKSAVHVSRTVSRSPGLPPSPLQVCSISSGLSVPWFLLYVPACYKRQGPASSPRRGRSCHAEKRDRNLQGFNSESESC